MEKEVVRHIHKYAKAMYVMVSIPENKEENIYKSPIILGCFKTKEEAKTAWKARTSEYKSIKPRQSIFTISIYKQMCRKYHQLYSSVELIESQNMVESYNLVLYPVTAIQT